MAESENLRKDIIRMMFDLPMSSVLYLDYACSLKTSIAWSGRMYPTNTHLCFYSNIFGIEQKIQLMYGEIQQISKTTVLMIQQAISVRTVQDKEYLFCGFWGNKRDAAYELISSLHEKRTESSSGVVQTKRELRKQESHSLNVLKTEVFPVSVKQFVEYFVTDDAKHPLEEFTEIAGSTELEYDEWHLPLGEEKEFGVYRALQYRLPVDAPIGPNSTIVDSQQRWKEVDVDTHVIDTATRLRDVPYGDYFSVEDRWTITKCTENSCQLQIALGVVFTKYTLWKGKIESRAKEDATKNFTKWIQLAKLKITPPSEVGHIEQLDDAVVMKDHYRRNVDLRKIYAVLAGLLGILLVLLGMISVQLNLNYQLLKRMEQGTCQA